MVIPKTPAITLEDIEALQQATILKAQGSYAAAENALVILTEKQPHFAAAFNNLGTVYFAEKKWLEAARAYQKAIDIEADYADAYYNLGLALNKLQRFKEAINVFQALILLAGEHPGAHFQLGLLWMQQLQFKAARDEFAMLQKAHPFHFETNVNLATSYLRLGLLSEARTYYQQALTIIPTDVQVLFNLGVLAMQQSRIDEAITYYLKAVLQDKNLYEAHHNLGFIFLVKKNKENALHHFREALRIQPQNEALQHTINILLGDKKLTASPPGYIRSLFDSYADHYDAHLLQTLHYQVPHHFLALLKTQRNFKHATLDILDIGCGTGLCGEVFKPFAKRLIGVDIAEKMLAVAAQKNIYDELITADIIPYLEQANATFDLILAGDVIVYFGDLTALFKALRASLKPGGFFIFNVEVSMDADYVMTPSGRFAHSAQYIERLVKANHLTLVTHRVQPLRMENGKPVAGHLYLLGV